MNPAVELLRPAMSLESALDRVHARTVQNHWLRLFTAMTRGLLAFGFILPGWTKVVGSHFSPGIPEGHRIREFFDAFFQAGEFYAFVGAMQILAALLLLSRRTTTLGAVLYLPIILNIFVITVAIDFEGTQVITGLMLLACIYLLCWDYDRWKILLPGFTPPSHVDESRHLGVGATLLAGGVGGLLMGGTTAAAIGLIDGRLRGVPLAMIISAFLLIPLVSLWVRRTHVPPPAA